MRAARKTMATIIPVKPVPAASRVASSANAFAARGSAGAAPTPNR